MLHDAPLPPWPGRRPDEIASNLDSECEWLVTNGVLPTDMVTRNRRIAEAALRPWTPVFTHGDLQVTHVFIDVDEITGVVDWSESGQGDALYDLASLASFTGTLVVTFPAPLGQVPGQPGRAGWCR